MFVQMSSSCIYKFTDSNDVLVLWFVKKMFQGIFDILPSIFFAKEVKKCIVRQIKCKTSANAGIV
jgi:hypothetical protein